MPWSYAYYEDGSLKTITAPEGVYTYTYRLGGQVDKVTYPNNSTVQYAYDLQHRLTRIQNWAVPSTSLISQYDYLYDHGTGPDTKPMKGMISAVTEQFKHTDQNPYGPYTTNYGYDALYQLTSANYPAFDPTLNVPWSGQTHIWAYDLIGNRTSYTRTNPRLDEPPALYYFYNLANKGPQLEKISPNVDGTNPTTTFSYDTNGNMFTELAGGVTKTYTWDQDDKMTGLSTSDASQGAAYTYSYTGDRLQRILNATKWEYLYSKEDILRVRYPDTSDPPMYLTQGPGIDDVLAETVDTTTNYAYKNMLSSVMQFASNGTIANNYLYGAWGEATNWPTPATDTNVYGYTGREFDSVNNYYYRNRVYKAGIGKFMSIDPRRYEAGVNFYVYTLNDPVFWTDPLGLTVYRCCRNVQVSRFWNAVANTLGVRHCWLKTDSMEAGMGPANGGELPSCPIGIPTRMVDHTGQSAGADCVPIPNEDEQCVNDSLQHGTDTGTWTPLNQCNSIADGILNRCRRCPQLAPPPPLPPQHWPGGWY